MVGLAGVMGGAKDSVLPSTDKVILEIANFQAAGVRRTALRYDNRTEASSRYEKGIDPERCDQALSLAMSLFRELYPDVRVTSFSDQYPAKLQPAEIDVSLRWLDRRLGKHLTNDEIARRLFLSDGSVKQYVHQIYAKLGLTGDAKSKRQQLIDQWHTKP